MKNNENSNGGTINQPIPEISRYRTSSNSVQPTTDIKFLYNFTKQINQKSTRSTTRLKKKRLLAHLTVLIVNSIPRSRSDLTHFQSNLTKKLFQRMLYPEIHPDLEVCRIVFGRSRSRHRSIDFAGKRSNRDLSCIRITRYRIHRQTGSIGSGNFVRKRERDGWLRSSCRVVAGSG